jgi:hypothetical protein
VVFPDNASCDWVVEEMISRAPVVKVVVPIPRDPTKDEFADVVESKFPTVSCVPVAISCPDELVVMMEFAAYVPVLVRNPESLLNHESFTEEEAMVFT